mgnify:CR=1 FL=1
MTRAAPDPVRRPRTLLLVAVAGLLPFVTAAPAAAQEASGADSTATLTGQVVSAMTGGPLDNASVVLKTSGRGAVTDSTGRFTIVDAPAGRDTVRVSLIGFAQEEVPLELKPDHTTRVTFLLSETVLKVEDISVEVQRERVGKLSGFEKRRKMGLGHFITPEEIEERNARRPSDLLRVVPGVSVGSYRLGQADVRITRGPVNTGCDVTYWVDGVPYRDYHIDDLNQDDLLAIEIYRGPSETPQQFLFQNEGCGTIVVWTREARDRRTSGN